MEDNPKINRETAWNALLFGMSITSFSFVYETLPGTLNDFNLNSVSVIILTGLVGATLLWVSWERAPKATWTLDRKILWGSVLGVSLAMLMTSWTPWYSHWLSFHGFHI